MKPHIRFFDGAWECFGFHHLPRAIGATPSTAYHRFNWLMNAMYAPELISLRDQIPQRPPLEPLR
ncbi:hypothetical protein [Ralstonia pickettii]|uniref:hypothetical protein n=1 Tax=Ralstonia pickettii TaxID=329 RepID=UPI0015FD6E4A|nr:hypothetical protein [Ralstonia pickettii]MBB0026810.1 hypothetical protein [Ralstonia pickettii]MBB0034692.1 hypothetical protein [Ralstonia pickettii]MBB0099973.1 hypothetical protein [Ralstonia pickettii]MBB0109932.1 hypothetical protein [Ralstonia pickettii]MBB0130912.1 hypothetical protein [Ralstonia pickettii]